MRFTCPMDKCNASIIFVWTFVSDLINQKINAQIIIYKQVSVKDDGAYECQLNTSPSRSLVVHLLVVLYHQSPPSK